MSEKEINDFLEPHLKVLRSISGGAGDAEILEAVRAIGAIQLKFNFPPVIDLAKRSRSGFDRALRYKDARRKNAEASQAADYFLARVHATVLECVK